MVQAPKKRANSPKIVPSLAAYRIMRVSVWQGCRVADR